MNTIVKSLNLYGIIISIFSESSWENYYSYVENTDIGISAGLPIYDVELGWGRTSEQTFEYKYGGSERKQHSSRCVNLAFLAGVSI